MKSFKVYIRLNGQVDNIWIIAISKEAAMVIAQEQYPNGAVYSIVELNKRKKVA